MSQLSIAAHDAHTATAAAAGGFDNHRVANAFGMGAVNVHIFTQRAVRARYGWNARFLHCGNGRDFVAHQADSVCFRTDKDKAGTLNLLSEVSVFGQKTITRVNSHRAGDFSCANDSRDIEVTFYGRSRANTDRLIR